jgi:putative NIF3 family GTP cyclohydrolase 1 type 2
MKSGNLTRREFAALGAPAVALVGAARAATPVTAREIVERIRARVGVEWRAQTVDVFKAGDPDKPVKGVAVTFMSTLSLLQKAVAAGLDFVVTHEPTFYNHLDETKDLANDPVYRFKQDYIRKHGLVIWRFHDHLHARKPDMIFTGFTRALGWERYRENENSPLFTLPPRSFRELARDVERELPSRSIRLIGNPDARVSRVCYMGHDLAATVRLLAECDVVMAGEIREWDSAEYARDLAAVDRRKGYIVIAHERLEQDGMELAADWIRGFVPEVPVRFISSGEPFWLA